MKVVFAVFSVGKRVDFRPFVFRLPCWPEIIDHWGWRDRNLHRRFAKGISTESPRGRKKRRTWRGITCCAKRSEGPELARSILEVNSGDLGGSQTQQIGSRTGHRWPPDMTLEMKENVIAELWRDSRDHPILSGELWLLRHIVYRYTCINNRY